MAALFVPAGIYLAWYLAFGRTGLATHRDPFTIAALLDVPAFVVDGAGTAIGSAFGVGPIVGRIGAVVLAVALGWRVVRHGLGSVPARTLAAFCAIVVQYSILGLIRAQLFEGAAEYSRYAYLSTIFALLGLAALVARLEFMRLPRWRVARLGILTAVATLALTWNAWLLIAGREIFLERADRTRATIVVAQGDLGPGIDPDVAMLLDRRGERPPVRAGAVRFAADRLAGGRRRPADPTRPDRGDPVRAARVLSDPLIEDAGGRRNPAGRATPSSTRRGSGAATCAGGSCSDPRSDRARSWGPRRSAVRRSSP